MPCHKRLKKGQQPAGIFQVFFLRVDVHILHGFQICPAAHALQRFFRYACAVGACGEGVLLEEPTTVSPLRRDADSLTEQQKFLSEPTSIPGMRRRLSFDGLVAFRCFQFPSSFGKHFLLLFLPLCCSRLGCGFFQLFVPFCCFRSSRSTFAMAVFAVGSE